MKRIKTKTEPRKASRPSIFDRQGDRHTFDRFPAMHPYALNYFEIR